MSYRDLRGHINKLEQAGELQRIKVEVDWDVELSAIMRRVFKQNGPACFFEKVKDSKFPVFSGAMFGHKKYSLMVDAPPNIRDILKKLLHCLNNPIDPVMVSSGHCKENIDTGDKINMEKFPVPKWHDLDGGKYIGTLGTVTTKDPETGIKNLAVYREQMLSKNKLGFNPEQHSGIHLRKYRAMNKPMPVATAIGVPPSVLAAALTKAPYGQDEMGIAGAIAGEPIPLVKCETVDLEVPADAEIVLEGEVPPDTDKWELEGPFGEFTGHFHSLEKEQKPTIYLTAVTYRNNPIYQGCSPGIPPNEETTPREMGGAAGAWQSLLQSGIPGIKEVNVTEMGCAGFVVIVSMDRHFYLGNVRQIIYHVMANFFMSKWVIVVDDDVDIFDMGAVQWALATRVQPHRDIIITDNRFVGVALDPSVHPDIRQIPRAQTSKIGIDATKFFKGHDFPTLVIDSEERQKQIAKRWKEYGFK
jgi:4-hydroxy-3-polyprenylbenzoate decarboxylase